MKRTVLLASVILALAGCGHKEETTTPPPSAPAPENAGAESAQSKAPEPPTPSGGPVAIPDASSETTNAAVTGANGAVDLNSLSMQLRNWMMGNRKPVPKSFEDWVAQAHITVPPPPAGKKYVIRHAWIVLEDK